MRNVKYAFWGLFALLSLLWLVAEPTVFQSATFFELRKVMVQYSGIIAMGAMSVAMILALRPQWPERWLGGMDKMYRMHKWLGIAALSVSIIHFLWAQGTKWAVGLGWLARPERGAGPGQAPLEGVEQIFRSLRHTAEGIGEWAFYVAAILMVLALVKNFPYRRFFQTHRLFAITYMILTFHAVILIEFDYWTSPIGLVMALLMAFGNYSAIVVLLRRVGITRQVQGRIASLQHYPGIRSLEVSIDVPQGWPGHKPGQFAFVTSDKSEGPHPYTIASAWNEKDRRLTFLVKELGDHTSKLREKLHVGQSVKVEGPYGCFDFEDGKSRQIWIGAGIGITPFLAKMKQMAMEQDKPLPAVDLFHTTADVDETMLANLKADAEAANIRLHTLIDARDGRLSGDRIRKIVKDWSAASMWFCGPAGFGEALRKDFAKQGVPVADRFHQELFAMR